MKIKKNEREIQAEAVRQDEEEKRIQAEVQGRLELQRGAGISPNPEQAPAIRVDISWWRMRSPEGVRIYEADNMFGGGPEYLIWWLF